MNDIDKEKKISVLICIGTRPEGVKLAPIIKSLERKKDSFSYKICSTGQHKEMLKQVFNFFEINPDYNLNLMTENQSLSYLSSKILYEMGKIIDSANPDIVLIQGDTTTAFLTALSAFYRKIKVGHIEAGLRTYDKFNPFPEEINSQLIGRVADFHFTPTMKSYDNLINENIKKDNILISGNTVVDAITWSIEKIKNKKEYIELKEPFNRINKRGKIILVTMHRRESFGEGIKNVCSALRFIANKYSDVQIIYPVHLNPNVRRPVFKLLGKVNNILLIDPIDYESFIWLMEKSYFIVTDSGGIQEEAPTLKKPVLVIRRRTERTESVDLGISKLIGTRTDNIIKHISELLNDENSYRKMTTNINPYGDGHSAENILDFIHKKLS